jgi:hypothetical protein
MMKMIIIEKIYKYGDEDNYIDERILTIKKKRKQNMIW